MGLREDVDYILKRFDELDKDSIKVDKKRVKKIPKRFLNRRKIRNGLVPVIWFGYNHVLSFKWGEVAGGLLKVDGSTYKAYEEGAVYFYKRFPVVAVFEWRLTPVGGLAEDVRSRVLGGDADKSFAKENGLASYAQQTIIRAVEQADLAKELPKKKSPRVVLFLVLGVVLLVVLGKVFGLF